MNAMFAATYPMATAGNAPANAYGSNAIPVTCAPAPTTAVPGLPQICTWDFLKSICKPIGPAPNPLTTNGIIHIKSEAGDGNDVQSISSALAENGKEKNSDPKEKVQCKQTKRRCGRRRKISATRKQQTPVPKSIRSLDDHLFIGDKSVGSSMHIGDSCVRKAKSEINDANEKKIVLSHPKVPQLTPQVLSEMAAINAKNLSTLTAASAAWPNAVTPILHPGLEMVNKFPNVLQMARMNQQYQGVHNPQINPMQQIASSIPSNKFYSRNPNGAQNAIKPPAIMSNAYQQVQYQHPQQSPVNSFYRANDSNSYWSNQFRENVNRNSNSAYNSCVSSAKYNSVNRP